MNEALEIRGLTKTFPEFKLDGLDLTLPKGCIMGLVGENGAGKSTTIKLILGLLRMESGTVNILGRQGSADVSVKEDIGVVLDEVGLPGCLTVAQVDKIMADTYKNWESDTYRRLIQRLEVPQKTEFDKMSRGNKMKLGIAVAMSHKARLLILDEATSGLDPVVRDEVVDMIAEFTRDEDHAVLMSSHIVSDLEKICDYIAFLHKGKLLLCREKDELMSEYGIVRCTAEEADALDSAAVLHRKDSAWGSEAIVRRSAIPEGMTVSPITIEELFIYMVKEAK